MIYRILADATAYITDPATNELRCVPAGTDLRGVFTAGVSEGMGDIPFPRLSNPRARFYFTEAGWEKYGRHVYAAARKQGHAVRVIRRKNPAHSQIVYQDAYQVAILPARDP
jgi:hypothetical protein